MELVALFTPLQALQPDRTHSFPAGDQEINGRPLTARDIVFVESAAAHIQSTIVSEFSATSTASAA